MVVNREWIADRLTGRRGEKARLAEALGVQSNVLSKILSGVRQMTPHEADCAKRFFGVDQPLTPEEADLLSIFRQLSPESLGTAKGLLRVLADQAKTHENVEASQEKDGE